MKKNFFFHIKILLCFLLDFICFSFFEQQLLFFMLAFFLLYIVRAIKIDVTDLALCMLLLSLESFFYCGHFGLQLLYLIPITIAGILAREWLHTSSLLPYSLLLICILGHTIATGNFTEFFAIPGYYTLIKIIANIIVMISISLIFYSQGKLGNRLNIVFWFQEESPDSQ